MRSRQFGFTLIEGLFSLLLVALVLGGIVHTLNQASRIKSNTKNIDQATEDFHALLTIQGDLHAALRVSKPLATETSRRLSLTRINPRLSYSDRTEPRAGNPESRLDPFESSERIEVNYKVEEGYLCRLVTIGDEEFRSRLLRVKEFTASRDSEYPNMVNLQLVVERERVEKTRILRVSLREPE